MSKNRRKLKTPIQRPPKGDCLEDHPPPIAMSKTTTGNKSNNNGSDREEDGLNDDAIAGSSPSSTHQEEVKTSCRVEDESKSKERMEEEKNERRRGGREEESNKSRAIPVLTSSSKTKKSGRKVSSSEKSSSKIWGEEEDDEKGGSDGSLANDKNCNGGSKRRRGDNNDADFALLHDNSDDGKVETEEVSVKRRSTRGGGGMMKKGNSIERSSEPSIGHSQETVGLRQRKKKDDDEEEGETNDESDFMQNRSSGNHHHDDSNEEHDDEDDDVNDSLPLHLATRNNGRKCLSPFANQVTLRSDTHFSRSLTRRNKNEEEMEEVEEEEDSEEDGVISATPDGNNNLDGHSSSDVVGSANLMQQLSKKFKEDDSGKWRCPVCSLKMDSQHTFTVHIRQHNPTDHSHTCSICGKTLSSASSLDRHMLIHSGERPFKCRICGMAFTTNGNMHRHMRTHGMDVDEAEAHLLANPPVAGRGRRRKTVDVPNFDSKSAKSVKLSPLTSSHRPTSSMTNMRGSESPPEAIRNGNLKSPFGAPSLGHLNPPKIGFFDLTFTDFSSQKFPAIAKAICEHSNRQSNSPYHDFECNKCSTAFPSNSALNLHESGHHFAETFCLFCNVDLGDREAYVEHVRTKHRYDLASKQPHPQLPEEKEGFMAMLQLHNRAMNGSSQSSDFLTAFSKGLFNSSSLNRQAAQPNLKVDIDGQSSAVNMAKMSDLADIQSIISLTKSGNHLINQIASSGSDKYPSSVNNISPTPSNATDRSSDELVSEDKESKSPINSSDGQLTIDGGNKAAISNEADHKCTVCAATFNSTTALKRHSRSHVSGGHNYTCHLCPYTSLDKSTLVRHLRTHNGERPFQCAICKYAFTTKANCERHVRKRHRKTNQTEISQSLQFSDHSGNSNLTIQNLNRHNSTQLAVPDQFKMSSKDTFCKLCSVDFKFDRVLRHHMKAVHGFVASVNGGSKSAKRNDELYNQKPYCCTLCKIGFNSKNNCLRHLSKQHPTFKDQNSCIVVNGSSIPSESNSDGSEDESSRSFAAMDFNHQSSHEPTPAHSGLNNNNSNNITSSFAALCEVAATNSNKSNTSKPLNLTSKNVDDYDAGDESEDQPFDLSKSSGVKSHQPLNLSVHPLDLSTKTVTQKPKALDLNDATAAADVLMTLRSAATKAAETAVSTMAANPFQAAITGHNFFPSPFPTLGNSLFGMGAFPPIPPQPAQFVDNILKILSMNPNYAANVPTLGSSKPIVNVTKNERSYSCKYCFAGFTLKSNMERHIKRKHPLYAKPSRSTRRSSSSDHREKDADEPESGRSSPIVNHVSIPPPFLSTTLSNKTRAALRDVLNAKGSLPFPIVSSVIGPESSVSIHSPVPFDSDTQLSDDEEGTEDLVDVGETNGDLASVSSLIDHTANSSQDLKKFLDSEGSDDHPQPFNSPSNRASSDETEAGRTDASDAKEPGSTSDGSSSSKKRSAYTDSPNSVSCPYCSRKFPWTSSLRRHILTHTGMKPFKCPKCPIFFTTKSNCERHLIRKHKYNSKSVHEAVDDAITKMASSSANGRRGKGGPKSSNGKSKQYKCNLCFSFCSTQSDLRKHYYLRHWTNGTSTRSSGNITNNNTNNESSTPSGLLKRKHF